MKHIESQESFTALDLSEARDDDCMHKIVDHEVFSGIVPTKCEPVKLDEESNICDEDVFRAILDSWESYIAYEMETTRNGKTEASEPTSTTYSENVFDPLRRMNNYGPPTRFRRRVVM
jgi:hypothetical protein